MTTVDDVIETINEFFSRMTDDEMKLKTVLISPSESFFEETRDNRIHMLESASDNRLLVFYDYLQEMVNLAQDTMYLIEREKTHDR
jgi:hypothetical protein